MDQQKSEYTKRINVVVDYINDHLHEKMQLDLLSDIAGISPFHFHRIAKAVLGQNLGEYITRLRVERAAKMLRYSQKAVADIAVEVGFNEPASLSRRFKKHYGLTPKAFREDSKDAVSFPADNAESYNLPEPRFIQLDDLQVAYIRLTGDYAHLDYISSRKELGIFLEKHQLFDDRGSNIGICHDDPYITSSEQCRYDMSRVVFKDFKAEGIVGKKIVPGGKFAVFKHVGPYEEQEQTFDQIYGHWLFSSPFQLRNDPVIHRFLNSMADTRPEELVMEILMPIS